MTRTAWRRPAALALAGLIAGCDRDAASPAADLLRHVPDDTPFAFVNSRPLPPALRARLGDHYAEQLGSQRGTLARLRDRMAESEGAAATTPEARVLLAYADAILAEFEGRTTAAELRELGIEPVTRSVLYGLGPLPAIRVEIADAARLDAMLDRVDHRAGIAVRRAELNGQAYRRYDLGDIDAVVAVTGRHLIAGLLAEPLFDAYLPLLLEGVASTHSLAANRAIERLIERHGFSGYGEGFVDLEALVAMLVDRAQGRDAEVLRALAPVRTPMAAACADLAERMVAGMPRMVVGITRADTEHIALRGVWESSRAVTPYLQRLAAPVPGLGAPHAGLLALGLGIDAPQLRTAIDAVLRQLLEAGGKCEWIDQAELQAARQRLNLVLGPMAAGLKGFTVRVDDVALDPHTLRPTDVRAGLLAAVDDPRGVLALGALVYPALASIEIPANGGLVALPQTPGPAGIDPPLHIGIRDEALLLLAGADAARTAASLLGAVPLSPAPLFAVDYGVLEIVRRFGPALDGATARLEAQGETGLAQALRERTASLRVQAGLFERLRTHLFATDQGLVVEQVMDLR